MPTSRKRQWRILFQLSLLTQKIKKDLSSAMAFLIFSENFWNPHQRSIKPNFALLRQGRKRLLRT
jgi:hypothetical protein